MKRDFQNIQELWTSLKTNGDRYKPVWDDISRYTAIGVDPNQIWSSNPGRLSQQLDEFVDDPTSAISVNQAGDYLIGIMWGTGDKVFDIVPSRYVLELADQKALESWYKFATDQVLYHINHSESGFHTALRAYAYDQVSFGTSGIGAFPNEDFKRRKADHAITFKPYGVDTTRIDEGKAGIIEIVFTVYRWRTNRIVSEMGMTNGEIDDKKFKKLPKRIRDAWEKNDFNQEFSLVCGIFPREDYDPSKKGKLGTKYRGVWFMDDGGTDNNIFYEEDFAERPINMARQIKVRGEVYGRSSGTLLISSIRAVNFMVGRVIEIVEKMADPALGMFNNAIFGDSVLDTSPTGLTIFNSTLANSQQNPLFPLYDVGDPSAIIQFLIPYLNSKIVTAFKIDTLLDFSSAKEMTAAESMQRYVIRGKSLSGMLQQQKVECLDPTGKRAVSIMYNLGELGVNPRTDAARATALMNSGRGNRVIPDAVLETIAKGRPWYELKWNNELEKLTRTQAVQNLLQVLQSIIAISSVYPDIIQAVDWYKLLKDINDNLDFNNQIMYSETQFKAKIAEIAQQRAMALQMQAGQVAAAAGKDLSTANKNNKEAQNASGK